MILFDPRLRNLRFLSPASALVGMEVKKFRERSSSTRLERSEIEFIWV